MPQSPNAYPLTMENGMVRLLDVDDSLMVQSLCPHTANPLNAVHCRWCGEKLPEPKLYWMDEQGRPWRLDDLPADQPTAGDVRSERVTSDVVVRAWTRRGAMRKAMRFPNLWGIAETTRLSWRTWRVTVLWTLPAKSAWDYPRVWSRTAGAWV